MFDINKELMKFYTDGLSELLNGVILRDKRVSLAGRNSAVIFVPKYLAGQTYKIILIPEKEEIKAMAKALDHKSKTVKELREKLRKLDSEVSEMAPLENMKPKDSTVTGDPEEETSDDEAY